MASNSSMETSAESSFLVRAYRSFCIVSYLRKLLTLSKTIVRKSVGPIVGAMVPGTGPKIIIGFWSMSYRLPGCRIINAVL